MDEKSKFDRKTPSAGFLNFIALWVLWSVFIGIITLATLAVITSETMYNSPYILSFGEVAMGLMVSTVGIYIVSRWQHNTLKKKTGRDFHRWALWSTSWWGIGMMIALAVCHRLMVRSGYTALAIVGIVGVGVAIIYVFYGFAQMWLLDQHLNNTIAYGLVLLASLLFWIFFIGDPRRMALGGVIVPAIQGLMTGVIVMWLFHLSKLGNIALKAKNETAEDIA